jgi:hypothetical protein
MYDIVLVSRGSSVSIASDYVLNYLGSIPGRGERIFTKASMSRSAVGSTQPPVQWVLRVLSLALKCGRGVKLTSHYHLVPRSLMSRTYTSSSPSAFLACSRTDLAF